MVAKHHLNERESMGVNMSAAIVTKRKPISINWIYCCTWYHPHKHHLLHPSVDSSPIFTNSVTMSTAHTWTTAKDQNLVSVPLTKDSHPSTECPSIIVKFQSPFSFLFYLYLILALLWRIFTFQLPTVDNLSFAE